MSPKSNGGVTVTQLQEQIAAVEGFRVSFERYGAADVPIAAYPFSVMAPSKWRISDWKRVRLAPYIGVFRKVDVYRGDDTPVKNDIRLVTLRDSYYEARYGTLEPEETTNVTLLDDRRTATPRSSRRRSE